MIPKDAKVCAQNALSPHLALREYISLFPFVREADYIALNYRLGTYPANKERYKKEVEFYKREWNIIFEEDQTIVMKRPKGWIDKREK